MRDFILDKNGKKVYEGDKVLISSVFTTMDPIISTVGEQVVFFKDGLSFNNLELLINNERVMKYEKEVIEVEIGGKKYYITEATDEKVDLTEQELSFVKAGRNVGELKKGDIIINSLGIIEEVVSDSEKLMSTLICPVENRTDLPGKSEDNE